MINKNLQLQTITIHQLLNENPCNAEACRAFLLQFLGGRPPGTVLEHEEIRITSQLVRRAMVAGVLNPYWFASVVLHRTVYQPRFINMTHGSTRAKDRGYSFCMEGYDWAEVDGTVFNDTDWELYYEFCTRELINIIQEGERANYAKQQQQQS